MTISANRFQFESVNVIHNRALIFLMLGKAYVFIKTHYFTSTNECMVPNTIMM